MEGTVPPLEKSPPSVVKTPAVRTSFWRYIPLMFLTLPEMAIRAQNGCIFMRTGFS
jgi:hypothetical protein